ncbi:glycosyltransferase family 1 protein [Chryseobacterium gotjawalense]|uniref:Glycosyltransferase family 1 protein n=1 Tax=Chryseobacterium gotjawalense TaxID=3042315 RepID=A0ABY8RGV7_9FLAO|nr:glycosyltransferase family 1 protein [Chryseobacterium sp. wdc7]WHF53046.1 glycosyltransferase family 1 protein [Chryseobacterium sp. wdc7]
MINIIFDNIIFSLQRSGGGSVYWNELIKRFIISKENCIFFDHGNNSLNFFRNELQLKIVKKETAFNLKIRRYLPFTKKISNKTIFHSSYYRYSNSKYAINVTTIHDLTAEKFRSGLARWINLQQKKQAVRKSKGIICISENTKKDLLHYIPEASTKEIRVIYNGVSDDYFKIDNDFDISLKDRRFKALQNGKYVLYVGHRSHYKNFDIAVKGMQECIKDYQFVIVGEPLSSTENSLVEKYLGSGYTVLSGLKNSKLNLLYNKAFALLYPSSYEGFGIPILEAMKTHCPVIANHSSSIPEVAGDAAILIGDIAPEKIGKAIKHLEEHDFRQELIKKGILQSAKFSWDKTSEEYLNFYKDLYEE